MPTTSHFNLLQTQPRDAALARSLIGMSLSLSLSLSVSLSVVAGLSVCLSVCLSSICQPLNFASFARTSAFGLVLLVLIHHRRRLQLRRQWRRPYRKEGRRERGGGRFPRGDIFRGSWRFIGGSLRRFIGPHPPLRECAPPPPPFLPYAIF